MISRVQSAGQEQQSPQVPRAALFMESIEPLQVFPSAASEANLGSLVQQLSPKQEVQQLSPKQEPAHNRLLEELLGINKMLETMSTASTRTDERCTACEASTLELKTVTQDMRRDIDGLQSRFLDLSDLIVARETMAADIEHLRGMQQELLVHLNEGSQQSLQSQVQAQLAEVHHEASLISAQHQLQSEQLQALQVQLLQQLQAQGDKQKAAEDVPQTSELVQYVASVKDLHHAELDALRQELQQAMKTSSQHTEGMAELHKKCDEMKNAAELLATKLPSATSQTTTSAAAPHREEAIAFAASVQDTRLEFHARLTSTFEELHAEIKALAGQVACHGLDLEAERATRALDLGGERAARAGVASDVAEMRLAIGQLSERLSMACREALSNAATKGSGINGENISAELAHCLSLHREALDVRFSELAAQLVASTVASTAVAKACSEDMRVSAEHSLAQHRAEVEQKLDAFAVEVTASADAAVSAAQGCAIQHCESIDQRLSVLVAKEDLQAEVKANLARHQEQASALTFAVDAEDKLFSELAVEREARIHGHDELAAYLEQTNACMEESHSRITQRVGDLGHLLQATDNCLTNAVRKEIDSLHEGMEMLATQVYAGKTAPEVLSGTKRAGALLQREMSDIASLADQMWRGVETY